MKPTFFILGHAILLAPVALADPISYHMDYADGSAATAYGPLAIQATVFAPGLPPGGRLGELGPVTLDIAGADGSAQTVTLYSIGIGIIEQLPGTYSLASLADTLSDATKRAQVEALLLNGAFQASTPLTRAALQAAVWEVAHEAGTSDYNVTTGAFQIAGFGGPLDPNVAMQANSDLSNVEAGVWQASLGLIAWQYMSQTGDTSFAYLSMPATWQADDSPIPEPGTLTLLAVGGAALAAGWSRSKLRKLRDKFKTGSPPTRSLQG